MAIFKYQATDSTGKQRAGTVDARSKAAAVALLKEQGLFVISLSEKKTSFEDLLSTIKGVPQTEIVAFTRQLSTMVSAGLPIARALEVLAAQTANARMKKILMECLRDVEGGTSLSNAFSRFPDEFSPTYQALVKAGESSGKLDEVLLRLADTMEADRELKSQFKSAMVYPIIVFASMVGVFVMMMVFVIPKLAAMYESLNVELPTVTKVMINASDGFIHYWYLVIIAVAGAFFGIKSFMATPVGHKLKSELAFKFPVFGRINKLKELAQFTRTLGLLVSAAIPIVEALNIVGNVAGNDQVKKASREAAETVEKGNSLSNYLKSNPIFPPIIGQMSSVGEETGKLDEVLNRVAEYFDSETGHAVKGLSAAMEPLILILLGGMVGVLIISIITPIYKITSAL